jgi:ectoine hydroxylase-related dioxygenase (phytanoyl-CoA dioxygenase family)
LLNKRQKDQFLEAGYVVVEDLISTAAFGPLIGEFEEEIEAKAQEQYAAGKLQALYSDAPFDCRLALFG